MSYGVLSLSFRPRKLRLDACQLLSRTSAERHRDEGSAGRRSWPLFLPPAAVDGKCSARNNLNFFNKRSVKCTAFTFDLLMVTALKPINSNDHIFTIFRARGTLCPTVFNFQSDDIAKTIISLFTTQFKSLKD